MRRSLASVLVGVAIPVIAAADIGQPSSFSVTISRTNTSIDAQFLVTTQSPPSPATSDAVEMGFFLFGGGGFPPSYIALPQSTTVQRGTPTSNRQFAASFSVAVPDPHIPFKYLAIAGPAGVLQYGGGPSSYTQVLSFYLSLQPDLDVQLQVQPPSGTPTPVVPVWLWAKGEQQHAANVPALSLWGLGALGALLAAAGALLVRRT